MPAPITCKHESEESAKCLAEVVAEEAQRPLYRVSTRELSFDPSSLKKQLSDHFILGRRWGAIMLIDEADMFMPKGQSLTPAQNATVTGELAYVSPRQSQGDLAD